MPLAFRQPPPARSLAELAEALGAALAGDGALRVKGVAHPRDAGPEELALAMDEPALAALPDSRARAAVVAEGKAPPDGRLAGVLAVGRPRHALAVLLDLFARPVAAAPGVHPSAVVEATAELGPAVSIGALCYVGPGARIGARTILMPHVTIGAEARIGADCLLHPGVRIGERVVVGDRVIIQANACLGADGFSYVTPEPGRIEAARRGGGGRNTRILRINSIGTVIVEDEVEIGACTTIDRATVEATVIRRGTKIDNLVQIAHNCSVGENGLIAAQTGIAGSVRVGDRVVMAGQVGIADHLSIGDDAIIAAGSGVGRDVPAGTVQLGTPAAPIRDKLQEFMYIGRLKRMLADLLDTRKRVAALEARLHPPPAAPDAEGGADRGHHDGS